VSMRRRPIEDLIAPLAAVRDEELSGAAESKPARALLAAILATPPHRVRRRRRRLALSAVAVTAAAAITAVAVQLGGSSRGTERASAATVLRHAAAVARSRPGLLPGSGRYLSVKSIDAYLGTDTDSPSFSAIFPHVREIWVGADGGWTRQYSGPHRFLSERDRRNWIAHGRPDLGRVGTSEARIGPLRPLDLPTDPDALYRRLEQESVGHGNSTPDEMLQLVGNSLRETNASPAQRAALYTVAARIPGVELVGDVTDALGRRGVAVAREDDHAKIRYTLVFDPKTAALLAEEQVVLPGNAFGYPAGTRIGLATYVKTGIVDSIGARPS
jgi:hypothetical protein